MDSKRWQQVEEVFRTAIHCPTGEREAYLTRVCGEDQELRQEVLSLLAQDAADDFLNRPVANLALALSTEPPDDLTGRHIGPYKLKRLVGRGGMGAVYEALRDDEQFEQHVALKLIRRGMDSTFVRERFLRERQILASLDHPHIARLLDGGTTPDGQPYFVMEFVDGEPITNYCERQQLSLDEKLKLFRDVCSAVQHAHQKLVVHRDLKPSNILVTSSADGKAGSPKLLDFGIAKLLAADPGQAVTRTETALRLMTPDYASPEQIRGGAITTATDVYALGVVLYELLTTRRPHQFDTYSPLAVERAICDTEAPHPSDVLERMHLEGGKTKNRGLFSWASDFKLQPSDLKGDLDNIVLMALRKEPERRYPSVEQFSEDLRRYLSGLPVVARKDTLGYRAEKFLRRHKAGVVALTMLIVLTIALAVLAVRLTRERNRANQAAVTAEALSQSLVAIFDFADPGHSRGQVITAKELLDQGAEKVVRELNGQPLTQARMMDTIGGLYSNIGVYDRAQSLMEESLKLRRQMLRVEHPDVASSLHHLAELAQSRSDPARSESLFREALAMRRKLLGGEHKAVADSMNGLGAVLVELGRFAEAEPLLRDALAMQRKLLGENNLEVAFSLTTLGRLASERGKFAEAADYYRQALALHLKIEGADHPNLTPSMNNLAAMLQELGKPQEAADLFREVLRLRRKFLGEEHPDVASSMANLASALQDLGELEEAERLYWQTVTLRRKLFGNNNLRLATTMNNLATLLREKGHYAEAETLLRQVVEVRRRLLGERHFETAASWLHLAVTLLNQRQYAEAERITRQALGIYLNTFQPDHWQIANARSTLGACQTGLKRYREAEEQLLTAYSSLKAARGAEHQTTRKTVSHLIELYEAWGKPDQAALYRALPQAQNRR